MRPLDIFILTLFQHGHKVRYSTLFHLLIGKRTSSILIYGYFNCCLNYLGLFPHLQEREYLRIMNKLSGEGYLIKSGHEDELVEITTEGRKYLAKSSSLDVSMIDNLIYYRFDEEFYELVLFASQVVSEAIYDNKDYYPLEVNPKKQFIMRRWFQKHKTDREKLGRNFFKEWVQLLELLPTNDLRYSVSLLLSGHGQVGLTFQQVVIKEDWNLELAQLVRKNYLHFFISEIRLKPENYPLFSELLFLLQPQLLNQSGLKTYGQFLNGSNLNDLVANRQIKLSTVTDHLVEAAILFQDFPFQRLLSLPVQKQLSTYQVKVSDFRNWRYRDCREDIPGLSFLEFRLYQILQVRNEGHVTFRRNLTKKI